VSELPESPERTLEGAVQRIDTLRDVILCNPFDRSTLKDPWLVGDIVWEKYVLDRFQACLSAVSAIQIDARPHAFAKEILGWLESLEPLLDVPDITQLIT